MCDRRLRRLHLHEPDWCADDEVWVWSAIVLADGHEYTATFLDHYPGSAEVDWAS